MKEYIAREAVEEFIQDGLNNPDKDKAFGHDAIEILAGIHFMLAADVAEVRHGRWIEDERTYPGPGLKNNLCSACGEVAGAWKEGLEPGRKWAYCPNCGARMGKEDEHEAD